jgi:Family of unknown function (DUF5946)
MAAHTDEVGRGSRRIARGAAAQGRAHRAAQRHRQSVFVHLVGFCAVLEHGLPAPYVTRLLGQVICRRDGEFPILLRTHGPGSLTVLDMVGADDLDDYERRAWEWAAAVWDSWGAQHELIRAELHSALDSART